MIISPKEVLKSGIIKNLVNKENQLQPNGIDLTIKETVTIHPMSYANVFLNETFDMQDTFGLFYVRSSLSRRGIYISSSVFDSHYCGYGAITIYNMNREDITIMKNFRIGQIIIFNASHINDLKKYNGHYKNNSSIKSKYEGNIFSE